MKRRNDFGISILDFRLEDRDAGILSLIDLLSHFQGFLLNVNTLTQGDAMCYCCHPFRVINDVNLIYQIS